MLHLTCTKFDATVLWDIIASSSCSRGLYIGFMSLISSDEVMRRGQNGHHIPDDIFKCIFLNENIWISMKISLKFFPKGPINNILALVKYWFGTGHATSHCLNQWCLVYWRIFTSLGLNVLSRDVLCGPVRPQAHFTKSLPPHNQMI